GDCERPGKPRATGLKRTDRAMGRSLFPGDLPVQTQSLVGGSVEEFAVGADESLDEHRRRELPHGVRLESFEVAPADPRRARDVVERHAFRLAKPTQIESQRAHVASRGVYALGERKVKARG